MSGLERAGSSSIGERLAQVLRPGTLILLSVCLLLLGCRTAPILGPVNLQSPGWSIRQGQAVWHRPKGGPEIAGDLLLATRAEGKSMVQFSKNGFPLMIAESLPNQWQVELPAQNKRYSGRGRLSAII